MVQIKRLVPTGDVAKGRIPGVPLASANGEKAQIADILRRCSPGESIISVLGSVKEPDPRFARLTLMWRPARRLDMTT